MPNIDNSSRTTVLMDRFILSFSGIVTVLTLGWVLWYCRFGIDFTDEGFYLVWMSNPYNYSVSATQFGFIYHPLYKLLDGNIAALRQANILITFSLSWCLSNILLKSVYGNQSLKNLHRVIISGAISIASLVSLVFAGLWLPTPSYNSLALQALLIAATGLLLADRHAGRVSVIGWFLVGVGGWLAFMAKPTTAAALVFISGFYLALARKLNIRLLLMSVATAISLTILFALVIDGSLTAFFERLKSGVEMYRILDGGHSTVKFLNMIYFQLGSRVWFLLIIFTVLTFTGTYISHIKMSTLAHGGSIVSIMFGLASLAIILGLTPKMIITGRFQGLLFWTIPLAAMLAGFSIDRFNWFSKISRTQWPLVLMLLVFPFGYAFGTSNEMLVNSALAAIFWVLAGFIFLIPFSSNQNSPALLLPLAFVVQMIAVILINSGMENPYRQHQSLRTNNFNLDIGKSGSSLVLSQGFGQYVAEAVDTANQAGFKHGMPMIDLTGQSPGLLYAMGASNIGQAWTVGGYPGSDALAVMMLKNVMCQELASAWLLAEPEGPIKISPEILMSFGANIATDFISVGRFMTAEGAGGYSKVRVQHLLKPTRSVGDAMAACVAGRRPNQ